MDPAKDPTPGSGGRERGQHLLDPTYMTQERSAVTSKFESSRIWNFETQRPSVGQNEKVTYQPTRAFDDAPQVTGRLFLRLRGAADESSNKQRKKLPPVAHI
jgi:hypothetical protein